VNGGLPSAGATHSSERSAARLRGSSTQPDTQTAPPARARIAACSALSVIRNSGYWAVLISSLFLKRNSYHRKKSL